MNFSLYIARRYLISKKSKNAINIISIFSVIGVAVGAMALIVVLSVFNGFDGLIKSMYNSFNPDLRVSIIEGKSFSKDSVQLSLLKQIEGVDEIAEVIEENALLKYGERQYIARLKGVSEEFNRTSGIDSMIVDGDYILKNNNEQFAVVGQGVAYYLAVGLHFVNPIIAFIPKREGTISTYDPTNAFKQKYIYPSGIFSIQQEFDVKYVIVPIEFMNDLLDYENELTALEIKLNDYADQQKVKSEIIALIGNKFRIKNRYEQNETFYKIMKSEKWAIYFILTFILIVASFNLIGSLTMLIIEKKKDIYTLQSMGANTNLIRKIFFFEGWMITLVGALIGLTFGLLICWAQETFGIIKLQGSGSFVIDAYPVIVNLFDVVIVMTIVLAIGSVAAWVPARYITRKHFDAGNNV
ncbi:FtsX-like permease family protein [Bacteroidota bacterium]